MINELLAMKPITDEEGAILAWFYEWTDNEIYLLKKGAKQQKGRFYITIVYMLDGSVQHFEQFRFHVFGCSKPNTIVGNSLHYQSIHVGWHPSAF